IIARTGLSDVSVAPVKDTPAQDPAPRLRIYSSWATVRFRCASEGDSGLPVSTCRAVSVVPGAFGFDCRSADVHDSATRSAPRAVSDVSHDTNAFRIGTSIEWEVIRHGASVRVTTS